MHVTFKSADPYSTDATLVRRSAQNLKFLSKVVLPVSKYFRHWTIRPVEENHWLLYTVYDFCRYNTEFWRCALSGLLFDAADSEDFECLWDPTHCWSQVGFHSIQYFLDIFFTGTIPIGTLYPSPASTICPTWSCDLSRVQSLLGISKTNLWVRIDINKF